MEIWKDIQGYEGLYQISNFGRVKSLFRIVERPGRSGPFQTVQEKILKIRYDGKGYVQVRLYKNGESSYPKVHRLVAKAFIPNPHNLEQVNHIDRVRDNNCSSNLEWVTAQRNTEDGSSKYYELLSPIGVRFLVYNLLSFCKENNLQPANIYKVLKKERNHHKGWKAYEK